MKSLIIALTILVGLQANAIVWQPGKIFDLQCGTQVNKIATDIVRGCLSTATVEEETVQFISLYKLNGEVLRLPVLREEALPTTMESTLTKTGLTLLLQNNETDTIKILDAVLTNDLLDLSDRIKTLTVESPDAGTLRFVDFEYIYYIEMN